jgi:hypothetical protein
LRSHVGWLVAVRRSPGHSAVVAGSSLAAERGCLRADVVKICQLRWVDVTDDAGLELCIFIPSLMGGAWACSGCCERWLASVEKLQMDWIPGAV